MAGAPVPVRVTDLCEGASCSCWVNGAADPLQTFQNFERELTRACKKSVHSRSVFAFKQKDLVVVKGSKSLADDVWLRGEVRCVFQNSKGEHYRVFLLDYGGSVNINAAYIVPCPSEFVNYPRQARLVRLFGLFPATIDFDLADENAPTQLVRSYQWTCRALNIVRNLIDRHDNAYFVPEPQLAPRDFEIFGDLKFEIGSEVIFLSKELVKNECALSCPDDYIKEVYNASTLRKEAEKSEPPVSMPSKTSKPQPVAPKASSSYGSKKTTREMFDEMRKHTEQLSNESESSTEQSTGKPASEVARVKPAAEVAQAGPAVMKKFQAYASRLSESANSSPQETLKDEEGAITVNPSPRLAIIPAGFEIINEPKNTVSPRISHTAVLRPSAVGEGDGAGGRPRDTSYRNVSDTEKTPSSRAPSKNTSESECSSQKSPCDGNAVLKLLLRNKKTPNSSIENNVTSDEATSSAHESERPSNRKRANITEILNKVKLSEKSANSSASSSMNVSRETVSPASADRSSGSVRSPQQVTKDTTPAQRLETRWEFHPQQECLFDRKEVSRVLIHGGILTKPWRNLSEAKFHPAVIKALADLNVDDLHALQQRAWPVIKKRQNVVMVGRKTQGKLLAYVAPVMDFVLDAEKPGGHGPLAIIVCPGYNEARQAYLLCKKMISHDETDVRVLMFHDSTVTERDTIKCLNGCDVLVTTPRCLVKLVQFSTNLHRLGVLVLDHAHVLLAKFVTEVKALMTEVKEHMRRQAKEGEIVQIVVSSHKWIPLVKKFSLKFPDNPTIIISCSLEAALYADPQVNLRIVKERDKLKDLLEILETVAGHQKVVVFCSSPEEVDFLHKTLKTHSFFVLKTSDNSTAQEMEGVKSYWDDAGSPHFYVLICTDAEFLELGIRDATCLIHYSMHPEATKTQFGSRFSCLMANYPSLFKERVAVPTVYILVDETNDHQLPGVINFMQRLGKGSEELLQIAKEGTIKREQEKRSNPLCLDLQMFGDCWDSRSCEDRHILLPEVDTSNLPKSGWVKLKILHTISACHFTARILEYSESGVDFKKWPNEYVSVAMKMAMRFNDPANRMEHCNPKVGDLCAVNSDVSLYSRAVIVKVKKEERKTTICDVRLLDVGVIVRKKAFELLYLPEELQIIPPQAVDIFVCRLKPKDLDDAWSRNVTDMVEEWVNVVNGDLSGYSYFKGKVVLSLSDRIWVDPLEALRHLLTVQTDVITRSFRRALLEGGLAEDNPLHLKKLYALCKQCGFQDAIPAVVTTTHPKQEARKQPIPQWAHLDLHTFELTRFICGENPQLFYVRRVYTSETLDSLMKEIQPIGESAAGSETVFRPGRVCLALCSADNQWARAVMQSTAQDERVIVFFVDYGDTEKVSVQSVAVIPDEIITKLPFQAIECSLVGIRSKGGEWSDDACLFFEDLCGGGVDCLYAKPVVSSCAQVTGGKHYKIILVDTTGESNVLINDLLINENIAESNEEEQSHLINPFDGPIADVNQTLYSREEFENPEEGVVRSGATVEEVDDTDTPVEDHTVVNGLQVNFAELEEEDIVDFFNSWFNISPSHTRINGSIKNAQSVARALPALPALPAPPAPPAPETTDGSTPASQNNVREEPETDVEGSSSVLNHKKKHMPALSSARAPQMIWFQDLFTVWIDVCPGAVIENYYLCWTLNHIQFSACDINGKYYYAELALSGTICPEEVTHCKQGLAIGIAARKACTGWMWPRLLRNAVSPKWLRHDSTKEFLTSDSDSDTPLTERLIKRAHKYSTRDKKHSKSDHGKAKFDAALSDEDSDCDLVENLDDDDQLFAVKYGYGFTNDR